ncbi:hypothetical protein POTOM_054867 [Populus tomentosa]|uniref:SecE/sec61-gamma protein transport protein n=1 Tax=Populus tomentosa TaxID=118781 RepID=A0A8X7XZJ7_POPTO|nr:hypothetical protein POTOM_054867 [Populus tomentosa]
MEAINSVFNPLKEFTNDNIRLVKHYHKLDHKDFTKVVFCTIIGFVVMGFIGFIVKLIFMPFNNIIAGSAWVND